MVDREKKEQNPVWVRKKLQYPDIESFIENYATNISRNGVFIQTSDSLPMNSCVRFELQLANEEFALRGVGQVVWIKPSGIGVKFMRIDRKTNEVIRQALEYRKLQSSPPVGLQSVDSKSFKSVSSSPSPVQVMEPDSSQNLLTLETSSEPSGEVHTTDGPPNKDDSTPQTEVSSGQNEDFDLVQETHPQIDVECAEPQSSDMSRDAQANASPRGESPQNVDSGRELLDWLDQEVDCTAVLAAAFSGETLAPDKVDQELEQLAPPGFVLEQALQRFGSVVASRPYVVLTQGALVTTAPPPEAFHLPTSPRPAEPIPGDFISDDGGNGQQGEISVDIVEPDLTTEENGNGQQSEISIDFVEPDLTTEESGDGPVHESFGNNVEPDHDAVASREVQLDAISVDLSEFELTESPDSASEVEAFSDGRDAGPDQPARGMSESFTPENVEDGIARALSEVGDPGHVASAGTFAESEFESSPGGIPEKRANATSTHQEMVLDLEREAALEAGEDSVGSSQLFFETRVPDADPWRADEWVDKSRAGEAYITEEPVRITKDYSRPALSDDIDIVTEASGASEQSAPHDTSPPLKPGELFSEQARATVKKTSSNQIFVEIDRSDFEDYDLVTPDEIDLQEIPAAELPRSVPPPAPFAPTQSASADVQAEIEKNHDDIKGLGEGLSKFLDMYEEKNLTTENINSNALEPGGFAPDSRYYEEHSTARSQPAEELFQSVGSAPDESILSTTQSGEEEAIGFSSEQQDLSHREQERHPPFEADEMTPVTAPVSYAEVTEPPGQGYQYTASDAIQYSSERPTPIIEPPASSDQQENEPQEPLHQPEQTQDEEEGGKKRKGFFRKLFGGS